MALGAATINKQAGKQPNAPIFIDDLSFAGEASYPAGGSTGFQAYVRAITGIREQRTILAVIDIGNLATDYVLYDAANDKLMNFVRTTGVEVAGAVNQSGKTFRVLVLSN
jgi:hypothetical protein